jgi:hypothetical protein
MENSSRFRCRMNFVKRDAKLSERLGLGSPPASIFLLFFQQLSSIIAVIGSDSF